ncbi:MAG: hypothetical protein OHK0047_02750 [Leptolyngbyaceae cyanobacterium]
MTTAQPNLAQLAKQGDARAIAALLNRSLQPKGITTKANLKDGCLHVMLEAAKAPEQQTLVAFLQKGLENLGSPTFQKVKVYGKQVGEDIPTWTQEFILGEASSSESTVIQESSNFSEPPKPLSLKERARQGDLEALTQLLNIATQHKGIAAKVKRSDKALQIMLESDQIPDEKICTTLVRRELMNLKAQFDSVEVYGRQISSDFPNWNHKLELNPISQEHQTRNLRGSQIENKASAQDSLTSRLTEVKGRLRLISHPLYNQALEGMSKLKDEAVTISKDPQNQEKLRNLKGWFSNSKDAHYVKLVGAIVVSGLILFFGYRTYAVWTWEARYRPVIKEMEAACDKLNELHKINSQKMSENQNYLFSDEERSMNEEITKATSECQWQLDKLSGIPRKPFN